MAGNYEMRKLLLSCLLLSLLVPVVIGEVVLATDVTITASPDYTGVPLVSASNATGVTTTSATLHSDITHVGGANATCRGFEWGTSTGNYTWSWNETGSFETGAFQHTVGNLTPNVHYFWRAFAINPSGRGNSTEQDFWTILLPSAPTNFTITQTGSNSINITWTMGVGANITVIRGGDLNYPSTVTDGYPVYSGNGTWVEVTGLNLRDAIYYYRAWSWNPSGYSVGYAQGSIGNISALTSLLISLVEGPTGIVNMMFAVALMGFAFWKKSWIRILLSASLVIWGVFEMQYDIKIAAPFIAVGAFLFILGVMRVITVSREASGEAI